jgi:hypothetical protein
MEQMMAQIRKGQCAEMGEIRPANLNAVERPLTALNGPQRRLTPHVATSGHFTPPHATQQQSTDKPLVQPLMPNSWILRVMVLRPMPRRCAASMRRPLVAAKAV